MLIVAGEFEVDPETREEFLASRRGLMERSRAEAGCLEYTFSADPLDPARVVLFERWESQEALDAHLEVSRTTPLDPKPLRPIRGEVVAYDVSGSKPL